MTEEKQADVRVAQERQYQHDYYKNKTKKRRLENIPSGRSYRRRDPGSPMIVFHLSMRKEEHAMAKQVADEEGTSMASIIMAAFHRDMKRRVTHKGDQNNTNP